MTEEEARTKWCPMARQTVDSEGNFYTTTGTGLSGFQHCIGSDCMMWRLKAFSTLDINGKPSGNGFCGLGEKL